MALFKKPSDSYYEIEPEVEETEVDTREEEEETAASGASAFGGLNIGGGNIELKVVRPESYEEVRTVADNLIAGCTVVLNVEALDKHVIFRMLDFLNGVTYCLDGEIKRVAPSTFIITPHSDIDISDM